MANGTRTKNPRQMESVTFDKNGVQEVQKVPIFTNEPLMDAITRGKNEPPRKAAISTHFAPLMLEGGVNLLFATAGAGKSLFATQCAIAADIGGDVGGLVAGRKYKVGIWDFENDDLDVAERYGGLLQSKITRCTYSSTADGAEGDLARVAEISDFVGKNNFDFLVIDNLYTLCDDLTESKGTKAVIQRIKRLTECNKATTLLVAHPRKNSDNRELEKDDVFGTSFVVNMMYTVTAIEAIGNKEITVHTLKNRGNFPTIHDRENAAIFQIMQGVAVPDCGEIVGASYLRNGSVPAIFAAIRQREINAGRDAYIETAVAAAAEGVTVKQYYDDNKNELSEFFPTLKTFQNAVSKKRNS